MILQPPSQQLTRLHPACDFWPQMPFFLVLFLGFLSGCQSHESTTTGPVRGPTAPHGDSMNNGGGISEQNLVYAHRQLPRLLVRCHQGCGLSAGELSLSARLVFSPLHFLSSQSAPEKFTAPYRRFGTWVAGLPSPGSPLFIDIDALYPQTPSGPRPIDVEQAAQSLIEAWALQLATSPPLARSLAERLGRLFSAGAQRLSLACLGQPEIGALVLEGEDTEDVSLVDSVGLYPVGNSLRRAAPCPTTGTAVTAWQFTNVHWLTDRDPIELSGDIHYRCAESLLSGTLIVRVPLTHGKIWRMQPSDVSWQYGDLEFKETK